MPTRVPKRQANPKALTLKQEKFVSAYLGRANGNATEAARLAGYQGGDMTARVTGPQLLKNPAIASRVSAFLSEWAMSDRECAQLLAEVARIPVAQFFAAGKESKASLADKVRALELLARGHGMLTERVQMDVHVKALIGVDVDRI